ncbi:serine hydrolase [Fibrella sp. HMF5335]|uniref:Serine hydrolase n=1 Tax=Fibrella rubiginis TaxID=2817060 RepID=A0A939K2T7_9BACT|nr:serine hydrolase [Fibrella rubiginis]MBO0938542.1 serine hydrolase [Fibrella rubiginis]
METRIRRTGLTLGLFLLGTILAFAQTKAAKIDALVRQYVDNKQFNGTVLVAEKGQVIVKKGYGMANMEWNIANTPDTKFRLGSITKQFTAMLIMQLVEQGKLKLNEPITTYLPNYPKATGSKITLHHLLTHTSGLPNYTNFPTFFETVSREPFTPTEFLKKFQDMPLEFEPGSKFSYSNSGYFLLGVVVEKVTGKSYAQVLQEGILSPLQMRDTGYDLFAPIMPKRAAGYEKAGGGYVNAPYLDMSIPYAAGSLYSTVEDLYKWDQALYTDKLLSAVGKATMFTPFKDEYAYGWGVGNTKVGERKDSLLLISHGGGINGFNTLITRAPRDKQLIVLLNNTGGAPLNNMRQNILRILYDQPIEAPKKLIADLLRQSISTDPVATVRQKFAEWKANKSTYDLNEGAINALGYELLQNKKLPEAIIVFDLNAEAFPASFNVYDSRGEAYMAAGDKAQAIRDYKKSVELNPRNTGGIEKLRELGEPIAMPTPTAIAVDTAQLAMLVGEYQLAPSFSITVSRENNRLMAQATGQEKFEIYAQSPTEFYYKVVDAQVSFIKNDKGEVDGLMLHQGGRNVPGKRVR